MKKDIFAPEKWFVQNLKDRKFKHEGNRRGLFLARKKPPSIAFMLEFPILLAGYATIRPVPDYTRLISFLRLNKAIATIGFTVKRGIWNNSSSSLYLHNRQFLETLIGGG